MDVDFDHAGIGRHLDDVDARIVRRRIAFDVHRRRQFGGRRFDRAQQFEIIGRGFGRRHEHAQPAVARLDRERRAHGTVDRQFLFDVLLALPVRILRAARDERLLRRIRIGRFVLAGQRRQRCERIGRRHDRRVRRRRPTAANPAADGNPPASRPDRVGRVRRASSSVRNANAADRRVPALHRQHVAGRRVQAAPEHARQARALFRVVELGIERRRRCPAAPLLWRRACQTSS